MKRSLKYIAGKLDVDICQRILAYSIIHQKFQALNSIVEFSNREKLWDYCLESQMSIGSKLTFVEFGVSAGYSIKYFANKNNHEGSLFVGLDSFEGLPENWGPRPKGSFSTNGGIPSTQDKRIHFIKGWFQYTWDELKSLVADRDKFVVHFDADLYSSTLFALTKMDKLNKPYFAIFDEFTGQETRALFDYLASYSAQVEFLGKVNDEEGYPRQLLCKIQPILSSDRSS